MLPNAIGRAAGATSVFKRLGDVGSTPPQGLVAGTDTVTAATEMCPAWTRRKEEDDLLTGGPRRSASQRGRGSAGAAQTWASAAAGPTRTERNGPRAQRSRPTRPKAGKGEEGKFIFFFSIFPKKFKMQFQHNLKSDFKPNNTKFYATA